MLKIHYLCGDKDNTFLEKVFLLHVVICSKFITFAVTKTTIASTTFERTQLWFAQNSLPLRWQRQPIIYNWLFHICCDLLKIHYLCGDKDNLAELFIQLVAVVICSKFITFAVTKTTQARRWQWTRTLWFAQNSLPLRWQRQLHARRKQHRQVVICSKFITFAVTKTTVKQGNYIDEQLWFAQNSLPLRWQRQQMLLASLSA